MSVANYSNCTDGDVRLVGGVSQYQGRVEVCLNRAWGTVCAYDNLDSQEAQIQVVCIQISAFTVGKPYHLLRRNIFYLIFKLYHYYLF